MVVYQITNLQNGMKYIGKHRKCNSNEEFQKGNYWGGGVYIWNAIQKYGLENFEKHALLHCKNEEGNHYEKLMIKRKKTKYPDGYNLTDGGDGGVGMLDITKRKIGDSTKGKKHTISWSEKIRIGRIGKKHTKYTKKILMKLRLGKIATKETKEKMVESHKGSLNGMFGKNQSEETKKKIGNAISRYWILKRDNEMKHGIN
jgi:group I intron endonuclease